MSFERAPLTVQQFVDTDGTPLSGGKVCTYASGTTTPLATYKDANGTLNDTEIKLNSRGECDLFLDPSKTYRFVLKRANGSTVWTRDGVASSAHVPGVRPFCVDENHLKMTIVCGVMVLSLSDSLVAKLAAKGIDVDG